MLVGLALAAPFAPGRVEARVGAGIEFAPIAGGNILSVVEGWHPAHATLDVGVLRAGSITFGLGVEGTAARQVFVNPLLAARRAIDARIPEQVPLRFRVGPEADWRWWPATASVGGRLVAQLSGLDGQPYLVGVVARHGYRVRAEHRDDPTRTLQVDGVGWGISAGAGVSSALPNGLLANLELRYGFPVARDFPIAVPDGEGGELRLLRRMRPPPGVVFVGSLGFRR